MEVMVSVHGEDPLVGDLFHCADALVTVVTVQQVTVQQESGGGGTGASKASSMTSPRPQTSHLRSEEPRVIPVRLPFQLQPRTPAEILRHEVCDD